MKKCVSLYIYIHIDFISFLKLLCIMKHYIVTLMKVVLNSIFIPSSEAPPPVNLEKITSKWHQYYWAHFEVLINLNGHFYNWKFIRKKCFSLYVDYMYTCISIFFQKYSYTLAFEFDRKHYLSVYFLLNVF